VSSFGFQLLNMPANDENYPEHAHAEMPPPMEGANDGQEEVYIPLSGAVTLVADGSEYALEPGTMARVGPAQKRKLVTRDEPARVLVIGAIPGRSYEAPPFTEIGASYPG
jgi:hypothetical protein